MNVQFLIKKAMRNGSLKLGKNEVTLRSLKVGTLDLEEAQFLNELGSNIYILSLFSEDYFDGVKKKTHKLYKANGVKKTVLPNIPVDPFFHTRLVQLIFSEMFPLFPNELDKKDYAQTSLAKVGKIGESAFYLDECNAVKVAEYCIDRVIDKVNRGTNLTYDQFYDMIAEFKELTDNLPDSKMKLFEIDEENDTDEIKIKRSI